MKDSSPSGIVLPTTESHSAAKPLDESLDAAAVLCVSASSITSSDETNLQQLDEIHDTISDRSTKLSIREQLDYICEGVRFRST